MSTRSNYVNTNTNHTTTTTSVTSTSTTTNPIKDSRNHPLSEKNTNTNINTNSHKDSNNFLISIKSASIDHIRYIQSFTTSTTSNTTNNFRQQIVNLSNTLTGKSTTKTTSPDIYDDDVDDEQWGEYEDEKDDDQEDTYEAPKMTQQQQQQYYQQSSSTDVKPEEEKEQKMHKHENKYSSTSSTLPPGPAAHRHNNNAQNDAIQFNLAISFNGRTYTATRALPSFIKLRHDLMHELSSKCDANGKRRERHNTRQQHHHHYHRQINMDHTKRHQLPNNTNEPRDNDKNENVIIPELPIGGNGNNKLEGIQNGAYAMMGMAASGFSGLQAAVKSYCPPMENWLQNVATLCPSSASLANFLWEPIHVQSNTSNDVNDKQDVGVTSPIIPNLQSMTKNKNMSRSASWTKSSMRRNNSMTLHSITEDTDDTDDMDEEESL
jgi:hypothetical protein